MRTPVQAWPRGLAMPFPAMSGAEPCTGSNMDGAVPSRLRFAAGATPMLPMSAPARSVSRSPKRLLATTTSSEPGSRTRRASRASRWTDSVATSGVPGGHLSEDAVPEGHRVDDRVRLRGAGHPAPSATGLPEGVVHDALAGPPREDAHLHGRLVRALADETPDLRVLALRVLADDDQVEGPGIAKRSRHALQVRERAGC